MKKKVFLFFVNILIATLLISGTTISLPRTPSVSPDGQYVVFSYNGDIWKVSIKGGRALRLTDNIGVEINPVYSPDGKYIAFSSDRNGNFDVFVMDSEGGIPRQLTFRDSSDYVTGWSPDGKYIIYHTPGTLHHFYRNYNVYKVPFNGGTPFMLIPEVSKNGVFNHKGDLVAFNFGTAPELRKRYRGTANIEIYLYNLKEKSFKKFTNFNGNDKWPKFSPDDKYVYFVSDRSKDMVFNLYKKDLKTGAVKQITFFKNGQVRFPSIANNKNVIVFEYKNKLYKVLNDGKPEEIKIYAPADYKDPVIVKKTYTSKADTMLISPDNKEIAFIVRGELFVMSEDGKLIKRLTTTPSRERDICWAEDGKSLYFTSDRDGNYNIFKISSSDKGRDRLSETLKLKVERITNTPEDEGEMKLSPDKTKLAYIRGNGNLIVRDIKTGKEKAIVKGWSELTFNWSPDSKWIAYSQDDNDFNTDIYIIPANGGKAYNISKHPDIDTDPVFSPDGKRLYFVSRRGEMGERTVDNNIDIFTVFLEKKYDQMNEYEYKRATENDKKSKKVDVKIDFDNINNRVKRLTSIYGHEYGIAVSPDSKSIAFASRNDRGGYLFLGKWDGLKFTVKKLTKSAVNPSEITFDKKGKTIYFKKGNGTFAKIGVSGSGYKSIPFRAKVIINRALENAQKYNEGWRVLWNHFYDPHFHGIDWKKAGEYYKPWAIKTRTLNDFNYVFTMLLGELNSSHQGIRGGWKKNEVRTGYIGVEFCPHYKGKGLRVHKVFKYSPANREISKLYPKDIILKVNEKEIGSHTNFYKLMEDTINKEVLLTVKRGKETKEIIIRPVSYSTLKTIIYKNIVESRRAKVEKLSNGKLTYIHIRGMGTQNAREFEKELYSVAHGKDGLIIDVRNNGGGWITDLLLSMLMTRQHAITIPRGGGKGYPQGRRVFYNWPKPIVVLINPNSYSNAEIFPWSIRTLKRGKLVGEQTFGAVISTGAVFLIDGTYVRMPFRGWYVNDGTFTNMEHHGCPPDVYVPYKLGELSKGEDSQLTKALEVLRNEVRKAKKLKTWPDWIDVKR